MPVLKERQGSVSIKELSELTCIRPDDILYTLQYLGLIQYQKGQHVLVAAPKLLDQHLREAGSWGLQVGGRTAGLLRRITHVKQSFEMKGGCIAK